LDDLTKLTLSSYVDTLDGNTDKIIKMNLNTFWTSAELCKLHRRNDYAL